MKNSSRRSARLITLATLGLALSACESEEPFPNFDELTRLNELHTMTRKPPADTTNRLADDVRAASLGHRLFDDPGLSSCGTVSCKSCHDGEGKTVKEPTALGCNGNRTGRNPPTTLNADYNRWFMWDGRADRLWNQAILPLTSPIEMDSNATVVRARLNAVASYAGEYQELFNKSPDATGDDELLANVGKLLQAYERTTNRTAAPFDEDVKRFIAAVDAGTEKDDPAYLGLKTYFRKGQCIVCHKGVTMADNLFHNIGVKDASAGAPGQVDATQKMLDWTFNAAGPYSDRRDGADALRLEAVRSDLVNKRFEFEGAYKTPTLRNIALTGPYMHTGELATLADVVEFYDKGGDPVGTFVGTKTVTIQELGLTDEEKASLVKLLESMTGAL
ncbi:cytochrome-c peroxidase [Hyalangium rubrum]|uniref:Cytochrome c peroxidase n=1 Tax=Hyalangium rubrum TaxID=3103134 RepID=A0ABU5HAD1_9BACT|nr:cytochrome c peroxidase [Hyalangium sp. s54d21]MDY7230261.1 cytochrome c peroxidase [Hyalangium sp. s54d21]